MSRHDRLQQYHARATSSEKRRRLRGAIRQNTAKDQQALYLLGRNLLLREGYAGPVTYEAALMRAWREKP